MKITFNAFGFSRTKKGVCLKCGKKCQKTERFEQTINPWNQKTPGQIIDEEKKKADDWMKKPIICGTCKQGGTHERD